eukprot:4123966-Prymnesium_polylepis.1
MELPANGTLDMLLPAGSCLWLQTAALVLAPEVEAARCVLHADSNGYSAVLCNLSLRRSTAKLELPFRGAVSLKASGPLAISLTGRHKGPLGPAEVTGPTAAAPLKAETAAAPLKAEDRNAAPVAEKPGCVEPTSRAEARAELTSIRAAGADGRGLFLTAARPAGAAVTPPEQPLVALQAPSNRVAACAHCGVTFDSIALQVHALTGTAATLAGAEREAARLSLCTCPAKCGARYCGSKCQAADAPLHRLLCLAGPGDAAQLHADLCELGGEAAMFLPTATRAVCTIALQATAQGGSVVAARRPFDALCSAKSMVDEADLEEDDADDDLTDDEAVDGTAASVAKPEVEAEEPYCAACFTYFDSTETLAKHCAFIHGIRESPVKLDTGSPLHDEEGEAFEEDGDEESEAEGGEEGDEEEMRQMLVARGWELTLSLLETRLAGSPRRGRCLRDLATLGVD